MKMYHYWGLTVKQTDENIHLIFSHWIGKDRPPELTQSQHELNCAMLLNPEQKLVNGDTTEFSSRQNLYN